MVGWGYNGSDVLTSVLTEVELPVVSNIICHRDTIHHAGDSSVTRTLTSNMFCAGHNRTIPLESMTSTLFFLIISEEQGSIACDEIAYPEYQTVCQGDSGSPMVFRNNDFPDSPWHVEGIVSHFFTKDKCSARRPGQYSIFTRVNR